MTNFKSRNENESICIVKWIFMVIGEYYYAYDYLQYAYNLVTAVIKSQGR